MTAASGAVAGNWRGAAREAAQRDRRTPRGRGRRWGAGEARCARRDMPARRRREAVAGRLIAPAQPVDGRLADSLVHAHVAVPGQQGGQCALIGRCPAWAQSSVPQAQRQSALDAWSARRPIELWHDYKRGRGRWHSTELSWSRAKRWNATWWSSAPAPPASPPPSASSSWRPQRAESCPSSCWRRAPRWARTSSPAP